MNDCPDCGRRLDDGECTRCGFKVGGVETTEAADTLETTAKKRPARKAREKN